MMLTPTYLTTSQSENVHELITPSLNHYYKTSHYRLQVGTHSFEGISPLWPPLPGKAIKLFFSTSPKTLSLRFNSVSGYRGWICLQCFIFLFPCGWHSLLATSYNRKHGQPWLSGLHVLDLATGSGWLFLSSPWSCSQFYFHWKGSPIDLAQVRVSPLVPSAVQYDCVYPILSPPSCGL